MVSGHEMRQQNITEQKWIQIRKTYDKVQLARSLSGLEKPAAGLQ